jgi:predicted phosphodiesterase
MRTAIASDIHGNAVALAALVADLERNPVDQVVCLGDVAQGGPQPAEVIDRLRELGWPIVMGNADDFLLDPDAGAEPKTPEMLEVRAWSVEQLGGERLDFIRSFHPTISVDLGEGRSLLAFHGSPASYDDIILPPLEEEQFRSFLEGYDASVLAGGHVHLQWLRRLGDSIFLNPGSVGLSYDHEQPQEDVHFDPWAAFAVVTTADGALELSFRRVPFEREQVVRALEESGIPDAQDPIERWTERVAGN